MNKWLPIIWCSNQVCEFPNKSTTMITSLPLQITTQYIPLHPFLLPFNNHSIFIISNEFIPIINDQQSLVHIHFNADPISTSNNLCYHFIYKMWISTNSFIFLSTRSHFQEAKKKSSESKSLQYYTYKHQSGYNLAYVNFKYH